MPQLPIGSYSMLNTDDICSWQMYRRYIVKDIAFVESDAAAWGNDVHSGFEKRLGPKKKPLPENMAQWEKWCAPLDQFNPEVEKWFGLRRDGRATGSRSGDCFIRCKIDCYFFDPRTFTQCMIFDWKTGKVREEPFELEMAALFLKAKFPQLTNITGQYVWLAQDKLGTKHDLSNVWLTWNSVYRKMTSIEQKLAAGNPELFEKTPGPLCGWCSVKDCEHNENS